MSSFITSLIFPLSLSSSISISSFSRMYSNFSSSSLLQTVDKNNNYPSFITKRPKRKNNYYQTITRNKDDLYDNFNLDIIKRLKERPEWTNTSRRVGCIATKCGMIGVYDGWGQYITCTVLKIDKVQVIFSRHNIMSGDHKKYSMQLGYGHALPGSNALKNLSQQKHFQKWKILPKLKKTEFHCSYDALLPSGTNISCRHFVPGQYVDIQGTSIGKGTQGVVKRWGFKGHPASAPHQRTPGSIGSGRSDFSRVHKGKKMAGRMGNKKSTVFNLQVFRIDINNNLIFVKGHVPGYSGNYVKIRDSFYKTPSQFKKCSPPFPTFYPEDSLQDPPQLNEIQMPDPDYNPHERVPF